MNRVMKTAVMLGALMACLSTPSFAQDVQVFAEGAYTANDLAVYIYAHTNSGDLRSFGVRLTYNKSRLTNPQAQKNGAVWFMGAAGGATYPYVDPQVNTSADPAEIVFIGGKLDTAQPMTGVSGQRVLLGQVKFARSESGRPAGDPEGYFGIQLSMGRGGGFANFVSAAGEIKDGKTGFGPNLVRERGDANGNKVFDTGDMLVVRNNMQSGKYSVIADCNNNGIMDTGDMFCIRNKF